jgi:hypothetical protein
MPLNIFRKPLLVLETKEAPPLWVVREGAAIGAAEEPAREFIRSLGTVGRRGSCLESLYNFSLVTISIMYWIYGAKLQDLRGLVAMFHISSTMYSKTSKRTGFMRATSKFLS